MSEYIGYGLSVVTFFLGNWLGKRDRKEQTKKELILKYYPPLLDDIRDSMKGNTDRFNFNGLHQSGFSTLRNMINNGTIKLINANDLELYKNLLRIEDEIIPALKDCSEKQMAILPEIKIKWKEYLESLKLDIDSQKFADGLYSLLLWDIWRKSYNETKKNYESLLKGEYFLILDSVTDEHYKKFIEIANIEMDKARELFKVVQILFKEIIEDEIIPKMEGSIENLIK